MPDTCPDLWTKARTYVAHKTQTWPQADVLAALGDHTVHAADDQINTALLANDHRACAAACRHWWQALLVHAPEEPTP